jgi:hypothetical protein
MENNKKAVKKSIYLILFVYLAVALGCASKHAQLKIPAEKFNANFKKIIKAANKEAKADGWDLDYEDSEGGSIGYSKIVSEGKGKPKFVVVTFLKDKEKGFLVDITGRPENVKEVDEFISKIKSAIAIAAGIAKP